MDPEPSPAIAGAVNKIGRPGAWTIAATVLWTAALIILLVRTGLHPHRLSSLTTYLTGGAAWGASKPLYTDWRGFVYPPAIACFFSLFTHLPLAIAAVLWRTLTAAVFLFGLAAVLRSGVFHRIPAPFRGIVFIAVLPLSIGNLDNAQANPLVAGLMMLSVAALQTEAWTLCAFAAAVAIAFKVYPVALALLLCLLQPGKLPWRIALILLSLALMPFALQDSHYVSGQYHEWLRTRLADDRFHYPVKDAPLDLWYLLVRLGNLPLSRRVYEIIQVLAGMGLAALVWLQSRRGIPLRDNLASLYLLVSVWMLLLGPATENQTYVVLAPAACLLAVQTLYFGSLPVRILALSAYGLLLTAVCRNSLFTSFKSPLFMAIQPVGALILLAAILCNLPDATPPSPR
jgi:hypothetical protein